MKIKLITLVTVIATMMLVGCGAKDSDIQKSVEEAIKGNSATANVNVAVADGVVTLSGEVADEAAKTAAGTAAQGVKGVKSVTNNITVAPPPPTAEADSGDKMKIEDALKKAGFNDVTVDTSTTPATLRGSIPKGKSQELAKVVQEAAGKPLKNQTTEK